MSNRFEIITTYDRLASYRRMFMAEQDGIELLILGRPGLAKSRSFMDSLGLPGVDFTYLRGNQTAFEMYRRLYIGRNRPVLLDDVDDALIDAKKKTLLKEALETQDVKTISWGSSTEKLVDDDGNVIPKSFATASRFCVIGNKLTDREL